MNHSLIFSLTTSKTARLGGSHRIATFLREQSWDVEVIDWAPQWTLDQLKELARSRITSKTIFCGFSTFYQFWSDDIDSFVTWLKVTYPHVHILVGGPRIPKRFNSSVDYYIHGYAENALLALVKRFTGNSTETIKLDPDYLGQAKVIAADKFYPAAPWPKASIIYEDRDFIKSHEWLFIEFSRGCKFKCSYCNYPFLGVKGDYTRNADDVDYQLRDTYERFGVTNYAVSDDTFNDATDKIIKYADVVENLPFQVGFSGFIRPDLLVSRPQDWEHLSRMNFFGQFYGIESTNPETAKSIGKGMDTDRLLTGIINAKNYFKTHNSKQYRGTVSLIVGLPHETIESMQKTIKWAVDNWQGESAWLWPLDIELAGGSAISNDWAKYGYRESKRRLGTYINFKRDEEFYKERLCWENDHMDLSTAIGIVDGYIEMAKVTCKFTPSSFYLERLAPILSIDELLSITYNDYVEQVKMLDNSLMIKEYIDNKLNL